MKLSIRFWKFCVVLVVIYTISAVIFVVFNSIPIGEAIQFTGKDHTDWTLKTWALRAVKDNDTLYFPDRRNKNIRFNAIYEDLNGQIWVGSNSGLHQLTEGNLKPMSGISPLLDLDQFIDLKSTRVYHR